MKKFKINPWLLVTILVIVAGVGYGMYSAAQPGKYNDFAKCLGDKGAIMYGAFWCTHCQEQKAMFGKSKQYLPYVECSLPSGQGQTQVCTDAGIESYPTWEFPSKERKTGALSMFELGSKTGCPIPQ